ncbi:MAG TPA: GDP-mannose 4,6-dehydratase [Candidatus Paceibacterota bacterium]|nr:GDP-mannose 4,6-dehydratase [Candidatus Paceibacterota bacterium]
MAQKRALITGLTGQDGSYLAELLIGKGYDVYGLVRRTSAGPPVYVDDLHLAQKIKFIYGNVRDLSTVRIAMEEVKPDEVYNLAAQSHVWMSFKLPDETWDTNYYGVGRVVNEAMKVNKNVRIYQASTSEMFGSTPPPQSESSPFNPVSPYAESKYKAHEEFIKAYRQSYGLFAASGILFNHESPRRGKHFVTRKITHSLAKIALKMQGEFALGNLEAKRDWGFAGDYVEAMYLMLQQPKPEDYVIATGETRTVREFVEAAAAILKMYIHWEGTGDQEVGKDESGKIIVRIDRDFYRPHEVNHLLGDPSKARRELGWKPKVSFDQLVEMMVKSDYDALKR